MKVGKHDEGKLRRENGRSAREIQSFLLSRIAGHLKLNEAELDPDTPFVNLGVDSVFTVELSGELEDLVGFDLSPTLLYDHPSVAAVARYLAADATRGSDDPAEKRRETSSREPIAVVGIGCRFPGAQNKAEFWEMLSEGRDAIREVPADRWDIDAYYDPNPQTPGKMNSRWGGFLDRVDLFDNQFFGIAPREAARMDPQQRLLLEISWEALEDAGLVPADLEGERVGVFIGISHSDYGQMQLSDPDRSHAYAGTGSALSIAANRLSYLYGFRGPSMAIDTACSSSLVSIYTACQSIWNQDCTMALAGGVNLILTPSLSVNFAKTGFIAPDGRCKTFDSQANGYVRGEGAGIVILKPLSQALADGDVIYATVRGGAINNDGRTNGLMAPSGEAQEALLREACRRSAISPGEITYVEAHGTGTLLGDPIEVNTLGSVLAEGREEGNLCTIGSVKTNIGHLEAAAGIASFIKVALILKNRKIPPSLHVKELNPHIAFDKLPVRVPRALEPIPESAAPLIAGVSSFGFGGTNAHVILQEYAGVREEKTQTDHVLAPDHLLLLSADSEKSLQRLAGSYASFLSAAGDEISLKDLCYSANVRRGKHKHRLSVRGETKEAITAKIQAWAEGGALPGVSFGKKDVRLPKMAFLFPSEWSFSVSAIRQLYQRDSAFRDVLDRCDDLIQKKTNQSVWQSLLDQKTGDAISPLAHFALQAALFSLVQSWGIQSDAAAGVGIGGVAAAYAEGRISLEEAVGIAAAHESNLSSERTDDMAQRLGTDDSCVALFFGPESQAETALSAAFPRGTQENEVHLLSLEKDAEGLLSGLARIFGDLFTLGYDLDAKRLYPHGTFVQLPLYPWERRRFWLDAEAAEEGNHELENELKSGFVAVSAALEEKTEDSPPGMSETVKEYYRSLAHERKPYEDFLSFAPFAQVDPDFSWILTMADPERHPENRKKMLQAWDEMRQVLFQHVDFSSVRHVVEIGSGYGTDLIRLAEQHPHLQLHGCNISTEQIEIAADRVKTLGLQDQIRFYRRDVAAEKLPDRYEMAFGVQVMHHILDKEAAFANLSAHLKNGGILVLAEIISNSTQPIKHPESSAYFVTKEEWADVLAKNCLQIVSFIDSSAEIGNFLYDQNFQQHLEEVCQRRGDLVKQHMEGPHLLGELLRRNVVLYSLLTVQKTPYLSAETLRKQNLRILNEPMPYSQQGLSSTGERGAAAVAPVTAGTSAKVSGPSVRAKVQETAGAAAEANQAVEEAFDLVAYLCKEAELVLEMGEATLDPHQSLHELGLDSIMALDLKQRIETKLGIVLPMADLLQGVSVETLAAKITEQLQQKAPALTVMEAHDLEKMAKQAENLEDLLASIHDLPEEKINALLKLYQKS